MTDDKFIAKTTTYYERVVMKWAKEHCPNSSCLTCLLARHNLDENRCLCLARELRKLLGREAQF